MKKFKELLQVSQLAEATDDWMKLNQNLAKALEYKGVDDNENILSFEEDYEMEESDLDYDTFKKECCPKFAKVIRYYKPEFSGGLNLTLGLLEDGSKVIYYVGGLISGYIARKEWVTTNTIENFKDYWSVNKGYISMELADEEIISYLVRFDSLEMAVDRAADYLLSQGLADVQE